jgi:tRNA pseudouridine38-40 synthase
VGQQLSFGGSETGSLSGGSDIDERALRDEAVLAGDLSRSPMERALCRIVLLVAYDGSAFRGFAAQGDREIPTVAGSILSVFEQMLGSRPPVSAITCAGRTDAGVHARGQVVHIDLPSEALQRWAPRSASTSGDAGELSHLARSLSSQLGPRIEIARALVAPHGFDARRSAIWRRYRYRILRENARDPLLCRTSWHVPGSLDLAAMRMGADALLGEHDFAAFCKKAPGHEGPIWRKVDGVRLVTDREDGLDVLDFVIESNAFCHHMVRAVVASLVQIGQARMNVAQLVQSLRTGQRPLGGELAPPGGLCLVSVGYPPELLEGGVIQAITESHEVATHLSH